MSAHVNYPSSVRILLLEPDIEVSELTAGDNVVPNAAWTRQAKDNVGTALNHLMATRNAVIVPYSSPDVIDPYDEETQLLKLHSAVGASILIAPAIPTRKDRFDWSMGPDVQMLGDAYDADYALFVYFRDSFATAGRKAIQFMAAFAGYYGVSGGSQFGFASFVDLRTGQVVWFNQLRSGGGDLRAFNSAMDATGDLLTDFPIAQGTGMATQAAVAENPTVPGQETTNLGQPSDGSSSQNTAMIAPDLPTGGEPQEGTWVARDGTWTAELSVFAGRFRLRAQCGRYFNSDISGELGEDGRIYMPLPKAGYYKAVVSGTVDRLYITSDNAECAKATLEFKKSNTPQRGGVLTSPGAVSSPLAPNEQPASIEGGTTQESHFTATESAGRPFDGRWVFEITEEGYPSELDRHYVEVSDGRFTVNIDTNGWRGPVSGEINNDGKLVGIGRFKLFNMWPRVVLFETSYMEGEFHSKGDAKGSGAAPRVFVLRLFRQ